MQKICLWISQIGKSPLKPHIIVAAYSFIILPFISEGVHALYISLYVIVFLVALLGNSLVIITIASNKRMRNLTNIFLLSMAVSDLLIALVCMPINLTGRVLTRFIFGPFMCQMFPYIIGKIELTLLNFNNGFVKHPP